MGIPTVGIFTHADADMPHAQQEYQPEAIEVPSYLDIAAIIAAAKQSKANAVHPGYGFLSENPAFVRECQEADIIFIGPSQSAMEALGDKSKARALAESLGVPIAKGYGPYSDPRQIVEAAKTLGPPLMLKAAAGGGGKGMKLVSSLDQIEEIIATSQRETKAAFGDDVLIVERFISPARHVEVQIFADGNHAIVLGERECSLQRRHQKIIEESPSTAVDDNLRKQLYEAAKKIVEAVGYSNAGTCEFLVDNDKNFYFLEVNTRLQVEHPVTELCTGLDLVKMQIEIASGCPLMSQNEVVTQGHAIEARLCAEDPWNHFLPSSGRILRCEFRESYARIDAAIGKRVSSEYDSLLAKIITHEKDRNSAIESLRSELYGLVLLGVVTNQKYLINILESDWFVNGETYTTTLEQWDPGPPPITQEMLLSAAYLLRGPLQKPSAVWSEIGPWRMS